MDKLSAEIRGIFNSFSGYDFNTPMRRGDLVGNKKPPQAAKLNSRTFSPKTVYKPAKPVEIQTIRASEDLDDQFFPVQEQLEGFRIRC